MTIKRLALVLIVVLAAAALVWASITLNPAAVQTATVGGVTVDTSNTMAARYMEVNWASNSARIFFPFGSGGNSFVASSTAKELIVSVDLTTGVWQGSNGTTGTLSPAQLTALQNTVKGWRNNVENFVVNQNIVNGTQVPW